MMEVRLVVLWTVSSCEGCKGTFWNPRNVPFLDPRDGYAGIFICKIHYAVGFRFVHIISVTS